MNKIIKGICILGVCILGISLPIKAAAESSQRRAGIRSVGNIDYDNKKVYFASSDLIYLADEIDVLEHTYKINTINSLNTIGTYFRNDGTIVYDSTENEADTEEEMKAMPFGRITEGIQKSQSLDSVATIQAADREGNPLFYETGEAQEQKNVNYLTNVDTGMPAYYQPASASNLSAGTAAWVNGRLVRGTGEDNWLSREEGRNAGIEEGKASCSIQRVNLGEVTIKTNGETEKVKISSYIPDWEQCSLSKKNFAIGSVWFASGDNYTDAGNSYGIAVIKDYADGVVTVGTSEKGGHESENCYIKAQLVCIYVK